MPADADVALIMDPDALRSSVLTWHDRGFFGLPYEAGKKVPAIKNMEDFLKNQTKKTLNDHWTTNPFHEFGYVIRDSTFVCIARSEAAVAELEKLEAQYGMVPLLVTRNARGVDHYYRAPAGIVISKDLAGPVQPGDIAVTGGRNTVIKLPPSAGKELVTCEISHISELNEASAAFINALYKHNGRKGVEEPIQSTDVPCDDQPPKVNTVNALDRYVLTKRADEIASGLAEEVHVLGKLALHGQSTVFYASPNTGKTLITIAEITKAIEAKRVNAASIYYVNVDDSATGLVEKLRMAEQYGFNMMAEGYNGFTAASLMRLMQELIDNGHAKDVILFLDTVKKFTDLMDKSKSAKFADLVRRFTMAGGTVIALAHVNKNRGKNGKVVPGGTSDIIDDFDCAYTITPISEDKSAFEKVVEFDNIKRRGNVATTAAYRYTTQRDVSYEVILSSVTPVTDDDLQPIKQGEAVKADKEIIAAIEDCIRAGVNKKMEIRNAVAQQLGCSRACTLQVLEKFTGTDATQARWNYVVGERGAKLFQLHETPRTGDTPALPSN